jgi:hypothetical protein
MVICQVLSTLKLPPSRPLNKIAGKGYRIQVKYLRASSLGISPSRDFWLLGRRSGTFRRQLIEPPGLLPAVRAASLLAAFWRYGHPRRQGRLRQLRATAADCRYSKKHSTFRDFQPGYRLGLAGRDACHATVFPPSKRPRSRPSEAWPSRSFPPAIIVKPAASNGREGTCVPVNIKQYQLHFFF